MRLPPREHCDTKFQTKVMYRYSSSSSSSFSCFDLFVLFVFLFVYCFCICFVLGLPAGRQQGVEASTAQPYAWAATLFLGASPSKLRPPILC